VIGDAALQATLAMVRPCTGQTTFSEGLDDSTARQPRAGGGRDLTAARVEPCYLVMETPTGEIWGGS